MLQGNLSRDIDPDKYVQLLRESRRGSLEHMALAVVDYARVHPGDPVPEISLRELRNAALELNYGVADLEDLLREGQDTPQGIEQGAIILNTALVHRERWVFTPESVTYSGGLKSYVVAGTTETEERENKELLYCGVDLFFGGEQRAQLARDDRRDEDQRQLGWSEESKKVLAACGSDDLAFITPSAGDVYKLMKAAVQYKDQPNSDGGKLFKFLKDHFWDWWTSTLDRVHYQDKGKQDILTYNIGLGPELERRISADLKGKSNYIQEKYARNAERALQDVLDTNDSVDVIKGTLEPYARDNRSRFWRIDRAGERVVRLGGYFDVGADDDVDVHGPSLRVARVSESKDF